MRLFTPELRYKQDNGVVIGREQLAPNMIAQLAHVDTAESTYSRQSGQVENGLVIEQPFGASASVRQPWLQYRIEAILAAEATPAP